MGMMTGLRSATGGLIAKIFIGLLALSFAVWGISDIFTGRSNDTLVKVGDTEITERAYTDQFRRQLRELSQRLKRPITTDMARRMGLDRQVLARLIQAAALDEEARRLGLSLSDAEIARRVRKIEAFTDPAGRFDVARFRALLARAGLSEAQFIDEERRGLLRNTLASAVQSAVSAPGTLIRQVFVHRNTARDVQFFQVRPELAKVPEPTPEQLKAYYEKNKNRFMEPQRRKLRVLAVLPKNLTGRVKLAEADIRAEYERDRTRFGRPETRLVEQIVFPSMDEAKKARAELDAGTSWQELAKRRGLSPKDLKLGEFTRANFPDDKLKDAVFALKEGEVSQPLEGSLSVVMLRVAKVTPASIRPFAEVKGGIARRLKLEKARDLAVELHDKVEEMRASGQSLADIAKALELKLVTTGFLSADGLDEKGRQAPLPAPVQLLTEAFKSDVGVENDVIQLPDDGFMWFAVADVKKRHAPAFDKIRDTVAAAWKKDRRRALLRQKAEELRKKAAAGEDMKKLAEGIGATLKTMAQLKRTDARPDLPMAAVRAIFAAKPDQIVVAPAGDAFVVVKSNPLSTPELDPKSTEAKAIARVLAGGLARDVETAYIAALQQEFGVKVNTARLNRLLGAGR
ncbi:MAG TPA: hypothetical protein ENK15_03820 [Thermopetrobacter sp.]|nr:hypothetical protein [Thermopetrobacter sp.]